jgi:hypothetical protein
VLNHRSTARELVVPGSLPDLHHATLISFTSADLLLVCNLEPEGLSRRQILLISREGHCSVWFYDPMSSAVGCELQTSRPVNECAVYAPDRIWVAVVAAEPLIWLHATRRESPSGSPSSVAAPFRVARSRIR